MMATPTNAQLLSNLPDGTPVELVCSLNGTWYAMRCDNGECTYRYGSQALLESVLADGTAKWKADDDRLYDAAEDMYEALKAVIREAEAAIAKAEREAT